MKDYVDVRFQIFFFFVALERGASFQITISKPEGTQLKFSQHTEQCINAFPGNNVSKVKWRLLKKMTAFFVL